MVWQKPHQIKATLLTKGEEYFEEIVATVEAYANATYLGKIYDLEKDCQF